MLVRSQPWCIPDPCCGWRTRHGVIANKEESNYFNKMALLVINLTLGLKDSGKSFAVCQQQQQKKNNVTYLVVNGSGYIQMSLATNHSFIITPQQL